MLKFILGTAGSGKTWYSRQLISELVENGERGIILLVPEQNNYESERAMLHLLGSASADIVEVASFTMLARTVASICGSDAARQADDGIKLLMMTRALNSVKGQLKFFGKANYSKEFCLQMLDFYTELRRAAVSDDDLVRVSGELSGSAGDKLSDIALIASVYEGMLSQRFSDPLGMLDTLSEDLLNEPYFKDRIVFFDAFKDFTEQQYTVIERILSQAKDVYVTVCTDTLNDNDGGMGIFSNNKHTAARLIQLANTAGVKVATPITVNNDLRFKGTLIRAAEQLMRGQTPDETEGGEITVCSCSDMYEEADYVARTVRRLVRTEGMRYRDFTVIARDITGYRNPLVDAFGHYGIPCFSDMRVDASSLMLFRFVLGILDCARNGMRNECMLPYIKSPLSVLSLEESSELENYALMWNKDGGRWREEWTENPEGLEERFDEEALARINGCRERVIAPVLKIKDALSTGEVRKICRAVYNVLTENGVDEKLSVQADEFDTRREFNLADVTRSSWDALMSCLDNTVRAFGDDRCEASEFCDMFGVVLSACDIGAIPDRIDEVIIGSADRIRAGNPKVTFIVGANYSEFPKAAGKNGLLAASERREIIKHGIKVNDCEIKAAVDEQYYVYVSVSSPSERLYITYHISSAGDSQGTPSEFVRRIREEIGRTVSTDGRSSEADRFEGVLPAVELVASERYRCFSDSLYRQLSERRIYAPDLDAETGIRKVSISPDTAMSLYGQNIRMSASKAETYAKCPFAFFCEFGIKAKPDSTAQLDVMRRGTLIHYVLEKTVSAHGKGLAELSAEDRRNEISSLLREYADIVLGGYDNLDTAFLFMLERISLVIDHVISRISEEFGNCDFSPDRCEMYIGGDEVPALSVPLEKGSIVLTGKIDRIDVYESDGRKYVRIVDYKTGTKEFDISDIFYGLNMQMLIYLFAVAKSSLYGETIPAGILYMPSKRPIKKSGSRDPEMIRRATDKDMRMNGLLVDDKEALEAMEHGGSGRFIPYFGPDRSGSYVLDAEAFRKVGELVSEMLRRAGDGIHSGCADIDPLDSGKGSSRTDACKYCNYRSVCLVSENDEHRCVEQIDLKEAADRLKGDDGSGKV